VTTGPTGAAPARAEPLTGAAPAGRDVLVIGSYPPVPTAGAPVTVAAALQLWREGARPHIVAPRASAAPLTVAVTGVLAGRRIDNLRRVTGAEDLVLCAERDLPIPAGGYPALLLPLVQQVTVRRVCQALDRFDHVTLIACGDHRIPAAIWARLVFAADTVIDRSDATGTAGVTTLGPPEPRPAAAARRAAAFAPRILGRHTPRVRAVAAAVARRVRARRSG
jgi:hypothetical protein